MKKNSANISVTIITNESNPLLISTIRSYADAVDEICLGVNGSDVDIEFITRETQDIFNLKIYELEWTGYGQTKNSLQQLAKNDWVLSVDADEKASEQLSFFLRSFNPNSENTIYQFRLINHLGIQPIHFGSWGNGKKYYSRLYNRKKVSWNHEQVHEQLVCHSEVVYQKVNAEILHFSAVDISEVMYKNNVYAKLSATVKFNKGQKTGRFKKYYSAIYTFLKEYIFQLGFLDGKYGWVLARENAIYSFRKYNYLYLMSKEN